MKLNISRIFETSKLLATEAGQQLQELITYMADLSEQSLRAFRNQLNFADNFDAIVSSISVSHEKEQVVNTGGKNPVGITVQRVVSTDTGVSSFRWWIGDDGNTRIWVSFDSAPGDAKTIRLVIFFS